METEKAEIELLETEQEPVAFSISSSMDDIYNVSWRTLYNAAIGETWGISTPENRECHRSSEKATVVWRGVKVAVVLFEEYYGEWRTPRLQLFRFL